MENKEYVKFSKPHLSLLDNLKNFDMVSPFFSLYLTDQEKEDLKSGTKSVNSLYGCEVSNEKLFFNTFASFAIYNVDLPLECKSKNSSMSIELRNQGNQAFLKSKNNAGNLKKAYELYCKSISAAPTSSQELALAYGNRSAVLKDFKRYKECIEDIDRALKLTNSQSLEAKLLKRRNECLEFICSEIEKLNICNKNLPKIESPNKKYPCASDAIDVAYSEEFGRHIIATRDIKCGEILIVEEAFCTSLDSDKFHLYCSNCLKFSWSLIPCDYCIHAMYCSQKCKNEAWEKCHEIECKVFSHLMDLNMPNRAYYALRMAILSIKQSGNIEKLIAELEKHDSMEGNLIKGYL